MCSKFYVDVQKHLPEIAQSEADIERVIGFLMKSNKVRQHCSFSGLHYFVQIFWCLSKL